ncbi:MAG: type VII toxin-antitoxin system HepT family RNase toxin [Aminivibrio sp.]|jgi:uncharacterized protein YutE (UPF0331/DUF86 family)
MMDDIALNKKEGVERCVQKVKAYYAFASGLPFEQDFLKQDAIAINIQRATELCIDLANHVVKTLKLGIPKESRESFLLLAGAGLIGWEMARDLGRMVGFRNVLVHDYRDLDVAIMKDVVENRLDLFVEFTVAVLRI